MKKILSLILLACMSGSLSAAELKIFAAASTTDLTKEIAAKFTAQTGITVKINPASSGILARQLESGAPGDVFISASKKWMDYAKGKKLVKNTTIKTMMGNSLVIIQPAYSKTAPFQITEKTDFPAMFKGRLSIGDPSHVPAGKYAVAALKYYKWYDALKKGRLLPAANVRAALMVVEMGETEYGIVYGTDAKRSAKVKVASVFPEKSHPPVHYYIAVCKEAGAGAEKLYKFLISRDAEKIIAKYGFTPSGK